MQSMQNDAYFSNINQKSIPLTFYTKQIIKNQPFQSADLYIESISKDLSPYKYNFLKAFNFFINKNYKKVLELLNNKIDKYSPPYIFFIYIFSLLKEKQPIKALKFSQKALERFNEHSSFFWLSGRAYLQKKDLNKAIKFLLKANSLCSKNSLKRKTIILADLGKAYTKKRNFSKALKYFSEGLKIYPNSLLLYKRIGMYYFYRATISSSDQEKEENFKLAINYFFNSLPSSLSSKTINHQAFLFFKIGLCFLYLKEFTEAEFYFRKVLNMQQINQEILNNVKSYLQFIEFCNNSNQKNNGNK